MAGARIFHIQFIGILSFLTLSVLCMSATIRDKRGAAYAGGHPGNGYGVGGVGIPGITSVIQYSAYNTLLNHGQHGGRGGSSGYGHGRGGHGRKLTVDEAIGMYGHHTLSQPYPYTASHTGGGSSGRSAAGGYGAHGSSGAGRVSYG